MTTKLSHLNKHGAMHMVDVGHKESTPRMARAEARVVLSKAARTALRDNPKGDVLAAARLAGIMAAKRTGEMIPLCHPLPLTHVAVDLMVKRWGVLVHTCVQTFGVTGVEMEALCAASVAALTLYDMLKSVDHSITIQHVRLLEKRGGKSKHFVRP